jgi:FADH2 O2-dependent halogenase
MPDTREVDFDVAIIGGGPGGAAMAGYLAKAGLSCVVFERELFPRPHVGESLVPSSNRVFQDLGFMEVMRAAKFPKKYGAIWTAPNGKGVLEHGWDELQPLSFADVRFSERKQEGVDTEYTFHVDRGQFDLLLLQHARKLGATVCQGVDVSGADFSDPSCVRIQWTLGQQRGETRAKMVVDASGRRTLLGSQLKLKVRDPVFDQVALHTWFEGYDRSALVAKEVHEGYIHVHFLPQKNSWVWQIPISDTVTSIGVVTQKKNFVAGAEGQEAFFWEAVGTRPALRDALEKAERIRPFKTEGDYSYAMTEITGDRVVLIGDAARFVDPIFSTGVSIALNSARFASQDIVKAVQTNRLEKSSFDTYRDTIRRGTKNWYAFISLYYRLNVLFSYYVMSPAHRLDVLKLLQGDVYDEESPQVLVEMERTVREVERDPSHLWHSLLGDLTARAFVPGF